MQKKLDNCKIQLNNSNIQQQTLLNKNEELANELDNAREEYARIKKTLDD